MFGVFIDPRLIVPGAVEGQQVTAERQGAIQFARGARPQAEVGAADL